MRALPPEVRRRRFGVEEYHRMLEAGVLSEDDRVELIGGEIVDMTPIGWRHVQCVNRLTMLLAGFAADRGCLVSVQNPVRLGPRDEPEPDLAVLEASERSELPGPEDVALVVEVSETSLAYDREVKLLLYAAAGIREVWIVDPKSRKVEVYTEPTPDGYRAMRAYGPGERVESVTLEGLGVPTDEVFG